jgi:DnaK suppressor protein
VEILTKNRKLTVKQVKTLTDNLIEESNRIRKSVGEQTGSIGSPIGGVSDQVDSANDHILLNESLRFSKRETMFLKKIVKALERADAGEYGECQECGEHINYQRLMARPTSEMCITCKEDSERDESQNIFGMKSKSLSQTLSFQA